MAKSADQMRRLFCRFRIGDGKGGFASRLGKITQIAPDRRRGDPAGDVGDHPGMRLIPAGLLPSGISIAGACNAIALVFADPSSSAVS